MLFHCFGSHISYDHQARARSHVCIHTYINSVLVRVQYENCAKHSIYTLALWPAGNCRSCELKRRILTQNKLTLNANRAAAGVEEKCAAMRMCVVLLCDLLCECVLCDVHTCLLFDGVTQAGQHLST